MCPPPLSSTAGTEKLYSSSSEIQFDCPHAILMRIPWPRVCTGYTVSLNHLCLTRLVHCSCPPADTLAGDGNVYLHDTARGRGGGEVM